MKNTNRIKPQSSPSKPNRKAVSNCLPWWHYMEQEKQVVITDNSMAPRAPIHSILTYIPGAKSKHGDVVVARLKGQTAAFIGHLKIQGSKFTIAPTNPEFKAFTADEIAFESVEPVVGWSSLLREEEQKEMARRVETMKRKMARIEEGKI
jgi:SOS-response transcriptional repressor LexA